MGQFPYECSKCGGGYKRCGQQEEHVELDCDERQVYWCDGGQFCWEDDLVAQIEGTDGETYYIPGTYTGYGYAEFVQDLPRSEMTKGQETPKPLDIYSMEFQEFFDGWGSVKLVAKAFICRSCFEKHLEDIDGVTLNKLSDITNLIPRYVSDPDDNDAATAATAGAAAAATAADTDTTMGTVQDNGAFVDDDSPSSQ